MGLIDLFKKKKKPSAATPAAQAEELPGAEETFAATREIDGDDARSKALLTLSDSVKWKERRDAARLLGDCRDKDSVSALCQALKKDESWVVRFICADSLGVLKDESSVPALLSALGDKNSSVVGHAGTALGKINSPQSLEPMIYSLEKLVLAFDGEDSTGISGICDGLGAMGDMAALSLLKRLRTSIHKEAVLALSKTRSRHAEKPLLEIALNDSEDPQLRATAILGLADIPNTSCGTKLVKLFSEAVDETLVKAAGRAIEKLNIKVDNAAELKDKAKRRAAERLLYGLRSVQTGMTQDDADKLVGAPSFAMGSNNVHKTGFGDFQLVIVNGKVATTLYMDCVIRAIEEYLQKEQVIS
ncbi:MAG: HEAT repeat domain-containing protein [Clostridiales bacterium]|jgi:HEAT repeat protein|nr:HEAT repeat domain-containing protein [Clostridiales bacterium]